MSSLNTLLCVDQLNIEFNIEGKWFEATREVSFEVQSGKMVCLVGESGCGKSITAMTILGLLPKNVSRVARGHVFFEGEDLLKKSQKELSAFRGLKIGMIFQEPMSALNPVVRVGKQICESALIHQGQSNGLKEKAIKLMKEAGIAEAEKRFDQYPHELSGGMRQRVMIAMALMNDPKLLIADEPTTALDVTIQAQILEKIVELKKERNMGILLITHDLAIVEDLGDEVVMMYAGEVVEKGWVSDVFQNPLHPYTRALQKAHPKNSTDQLFPIPGRVPPLTQVPKFCRFADRCTEGNETCRRGPIELTQKVSNHSVRCIRA